MLPIGPPAVAQKKSSSSKTPKSGLLCGGSRLAWPLQRVTAAWSSTVISLHVTQRYLYSQRLVHCCLYKPFPWILQPRKTYCAVFLHVSAFISLNMFAEVVSNNSETFFFWGTDANHAGQRPQRYPGLVQMAVGYKASQWASQVPAGPVLTTHLWPDLITGWHLGVAAVWAKSALWIETNYVGFLYISCIQWELNLYHLHGSWKKRLELTSNWIISMNYISWFAQRVYKKPLVKVHKETQPRELAIKVAQKRSISAHPCITSWLRCFNRLSL